MKKLILSTKYRKDFKKLKKQGKNFTKLKEVLELLATERALPQNVRLHKLSGDWSGTWECHVEPDWLLIFDISATEINLHRMGSHSDLF